VQGGWAVCIELPASWRSRAGSLRLRTRAGQTLEVLSGSGAVVATADLAQNKLTLAQAT